MEEFEIENERLSRDYYINALLENLPDEFNGPIYRGEEDLEAVRNSDSKTVVVVAADRAMVFCVSREKFLSGEIGTNADDLFVHAGVY